MNREDIRFIAASTCIENFKVGFEGEQIALECFCRLLPHFSMRNWVSELRTAAGYAPSIGNLDARESPCDFIYEDESGKLSNRKGARCFIEVKANVEPSQVVFTSSEWQLAEQLNTQFGRGEARVYVLVLVDIPKRTLREIIVDPVGEVNSGGMASTLLGMVLNTRQRGEDHPLLPFRGKCYRAQPPGPA